MYSVVPDAFKNPQFTYGQKEKWERTFVLLEASWFFQKGTDIFIDVFMRHSEWELYLCDTDISKELSELG